jgi:hypothetical protein
MLIEQPGVDPPRGMPCLRGAVRSATSISSITDFTGSSFGACATRGFLGAGTADAKA